MQATVFRASCKNTYEKTVSPTFPLKPDREKVIKLVEWPVFDKIILFLIAVNCAILIFDDPICRCASSDQCVPWDYYQQSFYSWDCSAWKTTKAVLSSSENFFTSLFAVEACAPSPSHPHSQAAPHAPPVLAVPPAVPPFAEPR